MYASVGNHEMGDIDFDWVQTSLPLASFLSFLKREGFDVLTWGNTRVNPNLSEGLSIAHSEGSVRVGQLLCLERTLPPTPVFHHVTFWRLASRDGVVLFS